MSGGHWNYMAHRLNDWAKHNSEVWRFLAVVEHELDWGICGDSCHDCARTRLGPAMEAFFDSNGEDATIAIALMRDRDQHQCAKCVEYDRRRAAGLPPK